MNAEAVRGNRRPGGWLLVAALAALCLAQCRLAPEADGRNEKFVTVRLNDSLSRFDSVVVQILAGGDTAAIVGTPWSGKLDQPGAIPSYRLADGESRELSIRVRAWDADHRLVLDETITQAGGKQSVTAVPIPQPSPRLASLSLSAGSLSPAFAPGTVAYTASVPHSQVNLQVTAVPEYAPARVFVGALKISAGQPSQAIPLDTGANRIILTVLAADTSDQYVLDILRAGPPDSGDKDPGDTSKPPPDTGTTVPPKNPADTAFPEWSHKGMVNLHLPLAPAGIPSAAIDFPLLLRLDASNFTFSEARDSGQDLRFMTLQGKSLDYSIARWDASGRRAEVYVRCDTLSNAQASPVFLMYWGNPKAAAASDPARVFSRTSGWTGVWHLEENGNGKTGEYQDAAADHPGTGAGAFPARVDGPVGYAQDFDGHGSPGRIQLPNGYDPGQTRFTLNLWIYRESAGEAAYLFIKSQSSLAEQRFELDVGQGAGAIGFGSQGVRTQAGFGIRQGGWTMLGIVCDGDSVRFYADGEYKEAHPFAYGGDAAGNVILGARNPNGDAGFTGKMDELWSFAGIRDAWYMRLLYENQKPGSTLAVLNRL